MFDRPKNKKSKKILIKWVDKSKRIGLYLPWPPPPSQCKCNCCLSLVCTKKRRRKI